MGKARGGLRDNAGPLHGLEDGWRQAKARAIEAALRLDELAVLQFFPHRATVLLPDHELTLGLPSVGTLQARQAAADAKHNDRARADIPTLTAALQAIDANITILQHDDTTAITTIPGRWIAPHSGYPSFDGNPSNNSLSSAELPNYSTHYVLLIEWAGVGAAPPADKLAAVVALLDEKLSSWSDWKLQDELGTHIAGFEDIALSWL